MKDNKMNYYKKKSYIKSYMRELWGVFSLTNKCDAIKRKELIKLKKNNQINDRSFNEFVIEHYWEKIDKILDES